MATYRENLVTTRDNIAARLADVTANPKPTYSENGRSISWTEYFTALMNQLKLVEERIQSGDGPWEIQSRGIT